MQFSRRVPKKSSLKKQLSKKYKQMVKATIQMLKGDVEKKNSGKKSLKKQNNNNALKTHLAKRLLSLSSKQI